jgi:hypothetical protein
MRKFFARLVGFGNPGRWFEDPLLSELGMTSIGWKSSQMRRGWREVEK